MCEPRDPGSNPTPSLFEEGENRAKTKLRGKEQGDPSSVLTLMRSRERAGGCVWKTEDGRKEEETRVTDVTRRRERAGGSVWKTEDARKEEETDEDGG
ncbi:hypothetical protein R1sor_006860 [Riccia sorocarpa]|uniref:Uncharacterized protein n=1 Tax=Riccia sorocarpa TaxID=122646 RepID=A0ABD3HS98_9MARC